MRTPAWLYFLLFEAGSYALLALLLRGVGYDDQWTPDNTITANWVKAVWFLLGHLLFTMAGYLTLSQRLPQKHRAQALPWFGWSLFAMLVELVVLMGF